MAPPLRRPPDRPPARRRLALAGHAPTLAHLERHVRSATPEDADRILLALVTRTVTRDDQLAGRVLLQLLLPGTRNLARRWWALGDHDERAAAAVGAADHPLGTRALWDRRQRAERRLSATYRLATHQAS